MPGPSKADVAKALKQLKAELESPEFAAVLLADLCNHEGEIVARKCNGYLNDKPAGTIEYLCADCGSEVEK